MVEWFLLSRLDPGMTIPEASSVLNIPLPSSMKVIPHVTDAIMGFPVIVCFFCSRTHIHTALPESLAGGSSHVKELWPTERRQGDGLISRPGLYKADHMVLCALSLSLLADTEDPGVGGTPGP